MADVRRWLEEALGLSSQLKDYRRILALTGPAGSAKTTTLRILAKQLGVELLEWRNGMDQHRPSDLEDDAIWDIEYESLASKFENFMARSAHCSNLFSSSSPRHVILLEDLPNILHAGTQERFQAVLEQLAPAPKSTASSKEQPSPAPIVVIVSDSGHRGEASDEQPGGWNRRRDAVVDIRSVLGKTLIDSPCVTKIGFNPIAPTLMKKALKGVLTQHFGPSSKSSPSNQVLDTIVDSSNGDVRSAVMTLQFACIMEPTSKTKGKKKAKELPIEAVTKREQSLALHHMLGKVLYNKRKGDPPSLSLTIRAKEKEKELDNSLPDPSQLPDFLAEHDRVASRVNVDALYANSPIDSSLYSLYLQQNYPDFCNTIEECDSASEYLSWVDAGCGADLPQMDTTNPFRFHLLTLGTLHSLPCPVTRRGQKILKPEFFEMLKREREAEEGIELVRRIFPRERWSKAQVPTELGGWLNARKRASEGPAKTGEGQAGKEGASAETGQGPADKGQSQAEKGEDLLKKGEGLPAGLSGTGAQRKRFWELKFRFDAGVSGASRELKENDAGYAENDVQDDAYHPAGPLSGDQLVTLEEKEENEWWRDEDDITEY